MFSGVVGIFALAVVATMVYQVVRGGSQGPKETTAISRGASGFYKGLMGGTS